MVYLIFGQDETGWILYGRALTAAEAWEDMVAIASLGFAARVIRRENELPFTYYWG